MEKRAVFHSVWLPLALVKGEGPAILDGFEGLDLVALDDLDAIAGLDDWEAALFTLFNNLVERGGRLAFAAAGAPAATAIRLPDLASRLAASEVHRLEPLAEADQAEALQRRAGRRGIFRPCAGCWTRSIPNRWPRSVASRFRSCATGSRGTRADQERGEVLIAAMSAANAASTSASDSPAQGRAAGLATISVMASASTGASASGAARNARPELPSRPGSGSSSGRKAIAAKVWPMPAASKAQAATDSISSSQAATATRRVRPARWLIPGRR